jgi:hypothetical protein
MHSYPAGCESGMYFFKNRLFYSVPSDEAHSDDGCATSVLKNGCGRSVLESKNSKEKTHIVVGAEKGVKRGTFIVFEIIDCSLSFQCFFKLLLVVYYILNQVWSLMRKPVNNDI